MYLESINADANNSSSAAKVVDGPRHTSTCSSIQLSSNMGSPTSPMSMNLLDMVPPVPPNEMNDEG
jgi:hypothetical protein